MYLKGVVGFFVFQPVAEELCSLVGYCFQMIYLKGVIGFFDQSINNPSGSPSTGSPAASVGWFCPCGGVDWFCPCGGVGWFCPCGGVGWFCPCAVVVVLVGFVLVLLWWCLLVLSFGGVCCFICVCVFASLH